MNPAVRNQICAISYLLQYPSDRFPEEVSDPAEIAVLFPPAVGREKIRSFISFLKSTPLLDLQEIYTAVFDLDPQACLYLTYHRWGQDPGRTEDLLRLQRLYLEEGYQNESGELPDYLPLVLEFLSVCDPQRRGQVLSLCGREIVMLSHRLREVNAPYAGLFEILTGLIGGIPPGDRSNG
jgi:nitrate reductase molybdenum cofactor assembly chaperone NarJ/NarW